MSDTFILGCERSGSTWLLNILDSHPATECWMEPCAPYARFFDDFPGRFDECTDDARAAWSLRTGFARLHAAKYPLLHQPGRSHAWRRVDAALMRGRSALARLALRRRSLAADRWRLLHLHQREVPSRILARKDQPTVAVTKELRLNLHAGSLLTAFPDARVVVAIRHPAAQIASIIRQFERGSLGELRQSLPALLQRLHGDERLHAFRDAAMALRAADDLPALLSVWWLLNYHALLTTVQNHKAPLFIACHQAFAAQPWTMTRRLMDFVDLDGGEATTQAFLDWCTTGDDAESPIGMRRAFSSDAPPALNRASTQLLPRVREVIDLVGREMTLNWRLNDYLRSAGLIASPDRLQFAAA